MILKGFSVLIYVYDTHIIHSRVLWHIVTDESEYI